MSRPPSHSHRTVFRLGAALLATLLLSGPVASDPLDTPAQAMAHAIARMMESMGFNGSARVGSPAYGGPATMDGWPSAFGPWSSAMGAAAPMLSAPGSAPMAQMGQMGQMAERFVPGTSASGGGSAPWSPGQLEGVWEDNQGGILIVQGGLYRLYSQCRGYIEGEIRLSGGRVELTNASDGVAQGFEYALDQGRLVLRGQSGEIFLYRRLVLRPAR